MTESSIAELLVKIDGPFPYRRYLAVPNVTFGWGLDYEADLIVVSRTGYATEIEIKKTKQDFLADFANKDKHEKGMNQRIARFYFAVPEALTEFVLSYEGMKPHYGVIKIIGDERAVMVKKASLVKNARRITLQEAAELCKLGNLRYWNQRMAKHNDRRSQNVDD